MSSCCPSDSQTDKPLWRRIDYIFYGSLTIILCSISLMYLAPGLPYAYDFGHAVIELFSKMWWGIVLGVVAIGIMSKTPRSYFQKLLGRGDKLSGVFRAAFAGLLLDLCSHGILLVGAKLYERGASLAQVMTFLIASPWNSLSLTLILFGLIGVGWTLIYIAGSFLIAIVSGAVYLALTKRGVFPKNPNEESEESQTIHVFYDLKERIKTFKPNAGFFYDITIGSAHEAKMLIRWLLLGVVLAAALRTFVPMDVLSTWFGPTIFGLLATLIATTIIEVCSEGSAPLASELFHNAKAPGNAFTFLMAGVSTDYTEIMILRETTKSWFMALSLPVVTVPQVILLGWIMNMAGT